VKFVGVFYFVFFRNESEEGSVESWEDILYFLEYSTASQTSFFTTSQQAW
jgi:hypothetical protein